MSNESRGNQEISFFDLQGLAGTSKHIGGFQATEELLAMCHFQEAQEVLEVGCGIGVGAAHMARKYGLRVVAVDLSDKMLDWARQRVQREGVAERVEFHQANVLDLPFARDRFDAVTCESVLAFVEDKPAAIAEMVRVCKPCGYVGINEVTWLHQPPAGLVEKTGGSLGTEVVTADRWRELWAASGLEEPDVRMYPVDPRQEVRARLAWIGWRQILSAWRRIVPLYVTKPAMRNAIKGLMGMEREWFAYLGHALMAGRKASSR